MNIEKIEQLKEKFTGDKARNIIIVIGLVALVLIFITSFFGDSTSNKIEDDFSTSQYRTQLTEQVLSMVQSIEGVGEAKILLTLENSYEYIYLEDGETLQKINEPTIRGVVVSCEGGGSAIVSEKISELLTTVLDIPSTKVCVTKIN